MTRISGHAVELIGGAALGAGIMYLFDPERGRERREKLSDVAGTALESTGRTLGTVAEHAHSLGHEVAERARGFGRSWSRSASRAGESLGEQAGSAKEQISNAANRATSKTRQAFDRLKGSFGTRSWSKRARDVKDGIGSRARGLVYGRQKGGFLSASIGGQAMTIAGIVLATSGAAFFLDPSEGSRRRGWVRQKFTQAVNTAGRVIDGAFHFVSSRASGLVSRTQGGVERARQASGHLQERLDEVRGDWRPPARIASGVVGGACAVYGVTRGGAAGVALAALGLGLLARGATNISVRRLTGISRPATETPAETPAGARMPRSFEPSI